MEEMKNNSLLVGWETGFLGLFHRNYDHTTTFGHSTRVISATTLGGAVSIDRCGITTPGARDVTGDPPFSPHQSAIERKEIHNCRWTRLVAY